MRKTFFVVLASLCLAAAAYAQDSKITLDELIAKHLASIGDEKALASVKSRGVAGPSVFRLSKSGAGQASGKATLLSEERKTRTVITVNSSPYTGEDFICDGSKTDVASTVSGQRSKLGAFVWTRREMLQEGLLGGTLTTAWPLLQISSRKPLLKYNGLKKVDGRELHEVSYAPRKGGSDLKIKLYFDPATFRHVLTVYDAAIPVAAARSLDPTSSSATNGADTQPVHLELIEKFDGFKSVDGFTLPGQWTLQLTSDVEDAPIMEWAITTRTIVHNQALDPNAFKVP